MTDAELVKLFRDVAALIELSGEGAFVGITDPTVFTHTANLIEQKNAELESLRAESAWLTRILNTEL